MATLNIGMKVSRAISGATTVAANAYAMVTYIPSNTSISPSSPIETSFQPMTRHFGPGQPIPSSFTVIGGRRYTDVGGVPTIATTMTITYSLQSGVELINTI